ncbi:unnamed protein product [Lathyrus sativus]|nr:unnamed protein product [Lathyrus sativus]
MVSNTLNFICSNSIPLTYSITCNVSGFKLEFTGYPPAPTTMPQMMPPPGAPQIPGQLNTLPRPPSLVPPPAVPGSTVPPPSNGAPSMASSAMYQASAPPPSSGGYDNHNANAQAPEANQ